MEQQQAKSSLRYDHHRSNTKHRLGTLVLTRNFHKKSKLDSLFHVNPKIIVKKHQPVYWVKDEITVKTARIPVSDLRPLMNN